MASAVQCKDWKGNACFVSREDMSNLGRAAQKPDMVSKERPVGVENSCRKSGCVGERQCRAVWSIYGATML